METMVLRPQQNKELLRTRSLKSGGKVHDQDFNCFENMVGEDIKILDVGANRGQSIVSFKTVLPHATIGSFEANPFFFPILKDVAKWYEGVEVHNYGLGLTEAIIDFYVPVVDGSSYLEEGSTRLDSFEAAWVKERLSSYGADLKFDVFPVEIKTADAVLGRQAIDVVKVDVEGAEMDVLSSMSGIIEHSHPVFLIENSDFHKVSEFLSLRGYECFQYLPESNSLVPFRSACTNSFYIHPNYSRGLHVIMQDYASSLEAAAEELGVNVYSEEADFSEHRSHIEKMDYVLGKICIPEESRVLDVGGGQGMHACFLAARFRECWCTDIIDYQDLYEGEYYKLFREKCERNGVVFSSKQLNFVKSNAMEMVFRNSYFDFVTSFNAFEHIPDPAKALSEMIRVTKRGGVIYITFDPIWTADTGSHFIHRVTEPWAHLVSSQEIYIQKMLDAGSSAAEISDFTLGMNQLRLARYREIFNQAKSRDDLKMLHESSWSGLVSKSYENHENYQRCMQLGYSEEELKFRGMCFIFRKL